MDEVNTIKVSITIPKYLLTKLDSIAKQTYNSRSGIIREAILVFFVERRIDEEKNMTNINRNRLRDYLNQPFD